MGLTSEKRRGRANRTFGLGLAVAVFLAVQTVSATTYMSVEPIPSGDVIGEENLARLRSIGYRNLERWSQRLLSEFSAREQHDSHHGQSGCRLSSQ